MKSTRQGEAWEWLCRLEELAVQSNLKMRILDAIRDCKRELEPELTESDWRQKCVEIEELLEQVKKQLIPKERENGADADVMERTSEILERCRRANELLLGEYYNGTALYIQNTEAAMQEYSNVKANYEEVTNPERFLKAFRDIGQKHKQRIDDQQEQYVKVAGQNYGDAFDRLSGLFSATGIDGMPKRKFYTSYYENLDTLAANVRGYARGSEKGESCVVKFAEEQLKTLKKLFSQLKRRAFLVKLLPVLGLIIYFAVSKLPGYIGELRTVLGGAEKSQEVELTEMLIDLLLNFGSFFMIKLPFILLVILVYYLWCRGIKVRHRVWVCNQAGKLLATAIEKFRQDDTLWQAVKESYQQVGTYMRRQYEGLLPDLLQQKEDEGSETILSALCAEWENIKRKAVEI